MKTFLIGLGAQKAGTSWLHDYLVNLDGFDPGFEKEYHILDARYAPDAHTYWLRNLKRGGAALPAVIIKRALKSFGFPVRDQHNLIDLKRLGLMRSMNAYVGYFCSILDHQNVTHTADITPEYAVLDVETLRSLRREFEARGVRVKSVFLIRDPVERVWSAARMFVWQAEKGVSMGPALAKRDEITALEGVLSSPVHLDMARYEKTISRLDQALGPENVHIEFYERLFEENRLRAITSFLGLPFVEPDFGRRVNASPKTAPLPETIRKRIVGEYLPTYRFVQSRFPDLDLSSLWPSSLLRHAAPANLGLLSL